MRVLIIGATGFIGLPLTRELAIHGHEVVALVRSEEPIKKLGFKNISILTGDLRKPDQWCDVVRDVDAVIHVAATFGDDMGEVDRALVEILIDRSMGSSQKVRFIYTGGCWLYGETGNIVADENTAFNPIPSFAWMVENSQRLFNAPCFDTLMVHPAMVYDRDGGAISRYLEQAQAASPVEVWGAPATRWPVVHREDLASAYRLVLEIGKPGQSYCVAAENGVATGEIAAVLIKRCGGDEELRVLDKSHVVKEFGEMALGPMLDQQMDSEKIIRSLGWAPKYKDILTEVG